MLYVGADPELFVRNGESFLSGHLFPCGTKTAPRKTPHGAVQVDGIALEFNVIPSATSKDFIANLKNVLFDLNKIVDECVPGSRLVAIPTAEVGEEFLKTVPAENKALGCNPDYNAYSLEANPVPNAELPFRTGSGHVHVGFCEPDEELLYDFDHFERCAQLSRQMDFLLGLPSLNWDGDTKRRELYGKAGAFRPKPYGMEYRVLSNAWVESENLAGFVFNQTVKAQTLLEEGLDLFEVYGEYAKNCINTGQTEWMTARPDVAEIVLG